MSIVILDRAQCVVGPYDLTGFTGKLDTSEMSALKPNTNFGSGGYASKLPGLNSFTHQLAGNADFAAAGVSTLFNSGSPGTQYAWCANPLGGAAAGEASIFGRGRLASGKFMTGLIGEVAGFESNFESDTAQVDGFIGAPLASYTTAGLTGTAVPLGGPTASQKLWAALYVPAAAGTNLAVKVQSDNASNFPSPIDRITFTTVSAIGWQFLSVAGDFSTETHHRVVATIASVTFSFLCVFGVR